MNMELLIELRHRMEVSERWKRGWMSRRNTKVLPEHTRMEIGKPKVSWSEGCEGQPEGLL